MKLCRHEFRFHTRFGPFFSCTKTQKQDKTGNAGAVDQRCVGLGAQSSTVWTHSTDEEEKKKAFVVH